MPVTRHTPRHSLARKAAQHQTHKSLAALKGDVGDKRYDRDVRGKTPWMQWYYEQRWKDLRRAHMRREKRCRKCGAAGVICDHVRPHKGDEALFYDPANLQTLCRRCHGSKTAVDGSRDAVRGS